MTQPIEPLQEIPSLAGYWLAEASTTAQSRVAFLGELSTITRARQAIEIIQNKRDLTFRAKTCSMSLESSTSIVRPVLPASFVDSMSESTRPAKIVPGEEGPKLHLPRFWDVNGARMDNPAEESMPRKASDPRVFDQSGDGNPGVTICLEGVLRGELYVVQRGWYEWDGTIVDNDTIVGHVSWGMEQQVVGASNRLIRRNINMHPDPEALENQFHMKRVSPHHPEFCA